VLTIAQRVGCDRDGVASNTGVVGFRGSTQPTGTTGLKLWAFRTLKNTMSNILSDRFTHIFSPVKPLQGEIPLREEVMIPLGGILVIESLLGT
jgi:hypothetical protein